MNVSHEMTPALLAPGEVHVWWARSDAMPASALDWLTPQERERQEGFRFDSDRMSYAAAHAMLRLLLASYGSGDAMAVFEQTARGKPFAPGGAEFNLSHTRGMVACALCADRPVGVDVENLQRSNDWARLLSQVLAPEEIGALRALPPAQQQASFYASWTLKEAWSKALGDGLSTDFRDLNVLRPPAGVFLARVETVPGFAAAAACIGTAPRVFARCFDWGTAGAAAL